MGANDTESLDLLQRAANSHSWENDTINTALDATAAAAREAGAVDGLPQDDFEVFLALTQAAGSARADTNPSSDQDGITDDTVDSFESAVSGVHDACDG